MTGRRGVWHILLATAGFASAVAAVLQVAVLVDGIPGHVRLGGAATAGVVSAGLLGFAFALRTAWAFPAALAASAIGAAAAHGLAALPAKGRPDLSAAFLAGAACLAAASGAALAALATVSGRRGDRATAPGGPGG